MTTMNALRDTARDKAAVLDQQITAMNATIADLTAKRDALLAAATSIDSLDPALKDILDALATPQEPELPSEGATTAGETEASPEPTEEPAP